MISTRETRRRNKAGLGEETTLLLLVLAVIAVAVTVWAALALGSWGPGCRSPNIR